ncbi:conserved hypothetical protein [Methylocella tundrae]|nr:conserved hypothetical protein [Methylocella tundrae]
MSFGRIGNRGRAISREFASKEEIWAFVRKGLRRRHSTVRRCSVLYRVLEASPVGRPIVAGVGLDLGEPRSRTRNLNFRRRRAGP